MIRSYQGHTPQIAATCFVDPSAQVIGGIFQQQQQLGPPPAGVGCAVVNC